MARIRTIKPGFFRSEDVAALPYRKRAIPQAVRREVAHRAGVSEGTGVVACHRCSATGRIVWMTKSWVVFEHELDHIIPERIGGLSTADNIRLACRPCNRRKGARV